MASSVAVRSVLQGKSFSGLLVICLALVAWFDFLFFRRPVGLNAALFAASLTGLAYWRFERLREPGLRWAGLPCLVLALGLAEHAGVLLSLLCLLALLSLAVLGTRGRVVSGTEWVRLWAAFVAAGWIRSLVAFGSSLHAALGGRRAERARSARDWLLPVTVSGVFVALFSIANPLVESFTLALWDGLGELLDTIFRTPRFVMWAAIAVACWAWLAPSILARREPKERGPLHGHEFDRVLHEPRPVIRALVCCNVVFAAQSLLDALYLWGGAALPEGMTYASYAHRGAYPLIVAALLAGAFILALFRRRSPVSESPTARRLVLAWLAQTLMLTFSAAWRLLLYVEQYSLTRWRVAAAIWMILVLAGLISIGLRLALGRTNMWLVNVNLLATLLVLTAVGMFDVDGFIASYNVAHCRELRGAGPRIDIVYLERLGPEALPALAQLARSSPSRTVAARLAGDRLVEDLLRRRESGWRGWSGRDHRLTREYLVSAIGP
ncbi:MAG: DUF4173 domain-containing protein [bacterium]|nr:DUF4173 domain-containing protein [bacterium]